LTRTRKTQDKPAAQDEKAAEAAHLSADLQAHIGIRLKAFYDSVLSEPIPDRFAELLNRLDTSEGAAKSAASTKADGAAASDSDAPRPADAKTDVRR
jgi:hypothetical protein